MPKIKVQGEQRPTVYAVPFYLELFRCSIVSNYESIKGLINSLCRC